MSYLPIPPRVWSRVQNECSVNTSSSNLVFEPLTGQYLTQEEYNRVKQIQIKGNILQYKNNSSKLTKKQKYSQIAKGKWTNRTKTWATQSLTYSNPNTTSLQRVNTSTLAATANTPFVTNTYSITPNPFNCPVASIADIPDGGNLVGTVTVNPCTNEVIKTTTITNCSLTTDSDVPGPPIALCWNPKLPTYYPRQNLTNNNSTDKWPFNYKGLVSALKPIPPILILDNVIDNTVYLSWTYDDKSCIPITSFNLYESVNGILSLINTIPFPITSTQVLNLTNCTEYTFYITALSTNIESEKSNEISVFIRVLYGPIITSITAGCESALLVWQAPDINCIDIVGYYVYQNDIKITGLIPLPITFPYIISPLSTCTDYDFNVSYYDSISAKESYLSNTATVTEIPCPPTITNITFDYTTNSQDISFNAPVTTCTVSYYKLYQQITPTNLYSSINISPYNLTAANLQSSAIQGEHTFYMTSYSTNNNTESINSNLFSIPPPPITLSGSLTSTPGEIQLTWNNQIPLTSGLSINKNKVYSNNTLFAIIDPSSNNYTMTGLTVGTTYTITVTAVATDISGNITESIFSNVAQFNLPPILTYEISGQNYNTTLSTSGSNYGVLIFDTKSESSTINFTFNYAPNSAYTIYAFAIGGGGNGGKGGDQGSLDIGYGGSGGGGGGGNGSSSSFNTTSTYNISVGGAAQNSTVAGLITGNAGSNGGNGDHSITSGAAAGGSGGDGNGGGGGGANGSANGADGTGGGGVLTYYSFNVNSKSYTFNYGGGGGGGGSKNGGSGGSPNGANGGYGNSPTGGGQDTGQNASYGVSIISNNYTFHLAGGGGGGTGHWQGGGGEGYHGGSGAQGIVVFYWQF